MKSKLVIVADLGCLKAYQVHYDELSTTPRMELIETLEPAEGRERMSDRLTGQAGRFRGGARSLNGANSFGERHNIQLELDRRVIKRFAESITQLVNRQDGGAPVYFAANKEIHHPILDRLNPQVRARISKVVPEDLTKINGTKLLNHFASP